MKLTILAIVGLMVSGCAQGSPEPLAACLSVIEANEKYPSTIRVVGQTAETRQVTSDEYANTLAGDLQKSLSLEAANEALERAPNITVSELTSYPSGKGFEQASYLRAWLTAAQGQSKLAIKTQRIDYDIDNGNGVPERKSASCAFAVDGETSTALVDFDEAVRLEKLRKQEYGRNQTIPNKGWPCCLPRFAIVSPEITGVAGGVMMADEIDLAVDRAISARNRQLGGSQ